MKKLLLTAATLVALATPAMAFDFGTPLPHQFSFEAATPNVDPFAGLSVSYVMRNEKSKAYALVNVTCSVYVGDHLVGSAIEVVPNVNAGQRVHGHAIGTSVPQKPDRAECSAQPQPFFSK
jgi:hypothetical protein